MDKIINLPEGTVKTSYTSSQDKNATDPLLCDKIVISLHTAM